MPLGEKILRSVMEQIFEYEFPKKRPEWLVSSEGKRLELDGYCEELGIAFEHHGSYHYQFSNFFHGEVSRFKKRQRLDKEKEKLVKMKGIKLVIIPEIFAMTKLDNLKKVLLDEFKRNEIKITNNFLEMSLDFFGPYRLDLMADLRSNC